MSDEHTATSITFESIEPNDWQVLPPALMHRGFPVMQTHPDENKNLTGEYLRILKTLDHVSGIPAVTDLAKTGFSAQEHAFFMVGSDELNAFKKLLYYLRGRQVPVWVPTFRQDFDLARESNNDVLYVLKNGFSQYGFNKVGKRDLFIEYADGRVSTHRILAAEELSNKVERITLEELLPAILTTQNVKRISFLALCRLDSDSVTLEHVADVSSLTRATLVWRSLRDDVERTL